MLVKDLLAIISQIRSRCFYLRFPAPNKEEIYEVLKKLKKMKD